MGHMDHVHHLDSFVAQSTRWRAVSHSLIYSAPNASMIWLFWNNCQRSWKKKKKRKMVAHVKIVSHSICTCSKYKMGSTIISLEFFFPENIYDMLQNEIALARFKNSKI